MPFFHAHTHSEFSVLDGMSSVPLLVAEAARMGHPAMALTDHGNMSGAIQLYKACQINDIAPFVGVEAYLVPEHENWHGRAKKYHVGLLALDFTGYKLLVRLLSLSHTRPRFNVKPRIDMDDLAVFAKEARGHVALTTGCYFGLLIQTLIQHGDVRAKKILKMYARLFPGTTYVELQNHCTEHVEEGVPEEDRLNDDDICREVHRLAQSCGLPVVVTQDSHYLHPSHRWAHDLMKRSVYGAEDDNVFPGDSYHLASERFMRSHFTPAQWSDGVDGLSHLLDSNRLTLPALEKFQAHVPSPVDNPDTQVRILCERGLRELKTHGRLHFDNGGNVGAVNVDMQSVMSLYKQRFFDEFSVIKDLHFAGYFMLVRRVVQFCEDNDILVEARGSSNGSLVCYLLGITQIDPIQWGTMFERFLSRDRIKPPDIDLDIEDDRRGEVLEYIASHFSVMQTGTYQKVGENAEGKGSVLVTYLAGLRKGYGDDFKRLGLGRIKTIEDVRDLGVEDDYDALRLWASMETRKSYGVHAAGLVLSAEDADVGDYVPTMLVASSNTTVTQFVGDDLEDLGFCKLDILGQRTLRMMKRCQILMERKKPRDFTWIPWDDSDAMEILQKAREGMGVFHFEQYMKSRGAVAMQPQTTRDVVLAMALFMPGAMDTGQTDLYLDYREIALRDPDDRRLRTVEYLHPAFEKALSWTYGAVVFQEQVIEIMRNLGMSIEAVNTFFKVVKDSGSGSVLRNEERLRETRREFVRVCRANGIRDVDRAWNYTAGFVAYGFNLAHAAGYGVRAYRCAYLKAHHTLEYMVALLASVAGSEDHEKKYMAEATRCGINLLPPDVNTSGVVWTMVVDKEYRETYGTAIAQGLTTIKGVGRKAAEVIIAGQPYKNVKDLVDRTDSRAVTGFKEYLKSKNPDDMKGVAAALRDAGALESLGVGRFS